MSIKYYSWRWRGRKPTCDQCPSTELRRLRIEVDWKVQMTKMTWQCCGCGNHVYVYALKKPPASDANAA